MSTRHGNHAVVLQFTQIVDKGNRTPRSYINFDATAAKGGHGIKGGWGNAMGLKRDQRPVDIEKYRFYLSHRLISYLFRKLSLHR